MSRTDPPVRTRSGDARPRVVFDDDQRSTSTGSDGRLFDRVGTVLNPVKRVFAHPLADYGILLGTTLVIQALGLIMVMSASTVYSLKQDDPSYLLFSRQLLFAVIGIVLMIIVSRLPVSFFRGLAVPAMVVAGVLLLLVLVPKIGVEVNGQRNWISLGGPFRLQPSEIAKLALVIWVADLLARRHDRVNGWRTLLLPLLPVTGAFVLLILFEGDLGTCLVIMPIIALMLLVAGAPARLFGWLGGGVLVLIGIMSITIPYRLARFRSWLDPEQDPTGVGYQVIHGQFALGTGGWWGVGLGASREKWGFLPEAHTDFILAVIGEELGLVGTLSVLGLFAILTVVIARIALRGQNRFVKFAAAGVGIWIITQALINIGAVLGALPITGLPLPLISYGGSSLTFTLLGIGMLLAFARAQPRAAAYLAVHKATKPAKRSKPTRLRRSAESTDSERGRAARRGERGTTKRASTRAATSSGRSVTTRSPARTRSARAERAGADRPKASTADTASGREAARKRRKKT